MSTFSLLTKTPHSLAIKCLLLTFLSIAVSCNAHADDDAPSPSESTDWYAVPAEHLVTFNTHYGDVVIALHPTLAPQHVARFASLIKAGFYDNQYFYRVVEGFVAQAGSNDTHDSTGFPPSLLSPLRAEFIVPISDEVHIVETNDMFAPATGFLDGFAVGVDSKRKEMWGVHCPGTVAFARNSEKDTASAELYIVIGQAPRHLDRNMSVIGRVVKGMTALQQLPRGGIENGGVLKALTENSKIHNASIGASNETHYYVQRPSHEEYQTRTTTGRHLDNPFFHDKTYAPRPIDVCYYQTKITSSRG